MQQVLQALNILKGNGLTDIHVLITVRSILAQMI